MRPNKLTSSPSKLSKKAKYVSETMDPVTMKKISEEASRYYVKLYREGDDEVFVASVPAVCFGLCFNGSIVLVWRIRSTWSIIVWVCLLVLGIIVIVKRVWLVRSLRVKFM